MIAGARAGKSFRPARAAGRLGYADISVILTVLAAATGLESAAGCSDPCCTTDGFPIALEPAAAGVQSSSTVAAGLEALASYPNAAAGDTFRMSIDTGSPLTYFRRHDEKNQIVLRDFDILDARPPATAVRGRFRSIEILPLDLSPDGPGAVLGGALLQNFSVQFDFGTPSMTFWPRQGASDDFLSAAGFAVIHFNLAGGAELTAESRPDFLGLTGPVEVPATRVVLRACAAPEAFDPETTPPAACCQRSDAVTNATGTNLALVVATGVGPLVLSQSAWDRVSAVQPTTPPSPAPGPALFLPASATPLTDVLWSTIPRIALVNQELDDANNPGACVDLGRARRLDWQEHHQTECIQPCDSDPADSTKAQNAAAYVELGTDLPVAIIPDGTPLLQGLRAEIRPEGPEVDGLIGANAFGTASVEIDYQSKPGRAIVTCASGVARTTCWASARCPRLSDPGDIRACFKQARRSLPPTCSAPACG